MGRSWSGLDPTRGVWRIERADAGFLVDVAGRQILIVASEASTAMRVSRWPRSAVRFADSDIGTLRGPSRRHARTLQKTIRVAVSLAPAVEYTQRVRSLVADHWARQVWLPRDATKRVLQDRPATPRIRGRRIERDNRRWADVLTASEVAALEMLTWDLPAWVRETNERIVTNELEQRREFFDQIEKSPLTEEQARAVLTFDNRVRVIAAAGSGKTSVMVARAAYAVERGMVAPHRILMLAFNAAAAEELRERVRSRLAARGLGADGVEVRTFHSFGMGVIGQATGHKPSIARWVEQGREIEKISEIVDELRDESPTFRFKWDLFRLLYGRMSDDGHPAEPDAYDAASGVTGFRTFNGETVRSEGERLIADWLFLNGVAYEYERPYAYEVSDAEHAQYRPDFFYPDVNVWHEHWAIGHDGKPPAEFEGYAESMTWRQQTHATFETKLIETTWHEIVSGDGFERLERDLRATGLTLDWNPDRPIPGAVPIEHERLAGLVRTFMSHVKSSSLDRKELDQRVGKPSGRTKLFLDIFWEIHARWQAALAAENAVDFDDMLLGAADHIEANPALAKYDLILVDEFQDTSRARARLVNALLRGGDKFLLAVGDDWQSINRFAGADLSVMTHFQEHFGPAETLHLQTTFRCTQTIADVASSFVSKNPSQLRKVVRSASGSDESPVRIVRVRSRDQLAAAVKRYLDLLEKEAPGSTVDILGRYRFETQYLPDRKPERVSANFRTVHSSKGLESDFVILPNMTTGTHGFPSTIADDPVLQLAMAEGDGFPHSEERRLFYVALTRARRAVTMFTVAGLESPFVVELIDKPGVVVEGIDVSSAPVRVCPVCHQGTLVRRTGRYGDFLGCSRFPKCKGKAKLTTAAA